MDATLEKNEFIDKTGDVQQEVFVTRSYQQEMFQESLKQNIIVAMDTGSGKTYIAVLRIRAELERCSTDQLVWFLAPSVALCVQQFEVLRGSLPAFQCRLLCGSDDVDLWSTQALWDEVLNNMRIVVSTPSVLLDALGHGFIRLPRLALIVFDEAHHCVKKDPGNQIMQRFYHQMRKEEGEGKPSVLGLTASPVMNAKAGGLETIEKNLDAVSKTPRISRTEMIKHVFHPEIRRVQYCVGLSLFEPHQHIVEMRERLRSAVWNYDFTSDPWIIRMRASTDPKYFAKAEKAIEERKTWCYTEIKRLLTRAESILVDIGWWAFQWYLFACISKFRMKWSPNNQNRVNLTFKENDHLGTILDLVYPLAADEPSLGDIAFQTSSKIHELIKILVAESDPDFTGIIFAKQRATVAVLYQILSVHADVNRLFTIGTFVGNSSYSGKRYGLSDLVDIKGQEETLGDFRRGTRNLIVATSVLEEGIDISACNTVICFDAPENLTSFVQRRGRARKERSKYMIFDADENAIIKWQILEGEMKEAYLNDARILQTAIKLEQLEELGERSMRIDSTGALLTLDNAMNTLHHFCQVVSSGALYDCRPEFSFEADIKTDLLVGLVTLPLVVERSMRQAQGIHLWRTERNARKDAAFSACVILHQNGLINDHLLPLIGEEQIPEIQSIVRQNSILSVHCQFDPWKQIALKWNTSTFHSTAITINTGNNEPTKMRMLLPLAPPDIPDFELYWDHRTTYIAKAESYEIEQKFDYTNNEIIHFREATHLLLESIMTSRPIERRDFVALFAPSEVSTWSTDWSQSFRGNWMASQISAALQSQDELGLVRDSRQGDSIHLFRGFVRGVPTKLYQSHAREEFRTSQQQTFQQQTSCQMEDNPVIPSHHLPVMDELCVRTSRVPKRRDFLHEPSEPKSATYLTPLKLLPASCCSIDRLPERYSVFALFLPSIMHMYEIYFIAAELRNTILAAVEIHDPDLILTAICSASAREKSNYQSLEFVGDCLLKFFVSQYLLASHPTWPEKYLTAKKGQMVANDTLAAIALRIGLDKFIISQSFVGLKWRPKYIEELLRMDSETSREMSKKVLADVVESLIGATLLDSVHEGQEDFLIKPLQCIELFFPDEKWQQFKERNEMIFKQSIELTHVPSYLEEIDTLIGYNFNKKSVLVEALTHASFDADISAKPYERLEFLGDAVLDYLVILQFLQCGRTLQHQDMHTMRTALVNADFLAFLCMELFVEQERSHVVKDDTTGEFSTIESSVKHYLWQFIRITPSLIARQNLAVERHEEMRTEVKNALQHGTRYPWGALASTRADKFFSDVIESILAAIYIDSKGSIECCYAFLEKLGIMPYLRRILLCDIRLLHPKEELGQLAVTKTVTYQVKKDTKGMFSCQTYVGDLLVASIEGGHSRFEVEVLAAEKAVLNWRFQSEMDES